MIAALVGLPNCGKSTLFNRLTGARQHVGNFPGVTVEKKSGRVRSCPNVELVDLPGLYSLFPYTAEEAITRDFLLDSPPDVLLQIADAVNPERHLYLTLQLLDLGIPVILALNLMDEAERAGRTYDFPLLEQRLGIPVVPLCASRGEGVDRIAALLANPPKKAPRPGKDAEELLGNARASVLRRRANEAGLPGAFVLSCAAMGEETVLSRLPHWETERDSCLMPEQDSTMLLTLARYTAVASLCDGATNETQKNPLESRTRKADRLLTHKLFAVPLFFLLLLSVFFLTFRVFGAFLQGVTELLFAKLSDLLRAGLESIGTADWLQSLLTDGVCAGVCGVLTFLPTILTLFFFLSVLEDSGYLARVAFVMDRPLRRLGLSGGSLVPLLIGFGCTVPALLAARTLPSKKERMLTVLLLPFVACSAKIPLLTLACGAFFPRRAPYVLFFLYLFGIICGLLSVKLQSRFILQRETQAFLLELPPYRFPTLQTTLLHMWEKAKEFVKKAFTVVLLSTLVIWFLRSFGTSMQMVSQEESLLAYLASGLAVLLAPLGFGDWRLAAALLSGLSAKESVVSTLAVLFSATEYDLPEALLQSNVLASDASALAFLVFFLLYLPCFASLGTMARELGKRRYALAAFAYQLAAAWILSFAVYHVALLLT